eukprot:TRINITY_DN5613_c0_g1_i2.p1 TRINITY_DN5613_c0_g1~~TRINITY_DN5613_c0_g1_i2.p1  ORF type:complete len:252 (-),score=67.09 TRINITY_DN5613_c0_g1_i2:23-727(-)
MSSPSHPPPSVPPALPRENQPPLAARSDALGILEANILKWEKISSGYKIAEGDVDALSKTGTEIVSELRKLQRLIAKRNGLFTPKLKPLFPPWSQEDDAMFRQVHDELAAIGEVESRKIHERLPHKDPRDVTRYLKNFKAREKRRDEAAHGERPAKRVRTQRPPQQNGHPDEDEDFGSDSEDDGMDQYEGESDSDEELEEDFERSKAKQPSAPVAPPAVSYFDHTLTLFFFIAR